MCGICGFTGYRQDQKTVIERMMKAIEHRGPDSEGSFCREKITLGFRRLSIIDLEDGQQPMESADGNLHIVFNGEIYDYKELRAELETFGISFCTHSDTEVLVNTLQQYGEKALDKLRGMFGFAVWNEKEQTLMLARDFFGIKPVYYAEIDGHFVFASEIKSILAFPGYERKVNQKALEQYLSFQYSPLEETFFKGIYKLMPGHMLLYKNGSYEIKTYFKPKLTPGQWNHKTNMAQLRSQLSEILKDSVKHHMLSDVEVGAFLSGGVDSGYLASASGADQAFTVGFDEGDRYSEVNKAAKVAEKAGLKHHVKIISKQEFWDALPDVMYHMDEPLGDASAVALYFLSKEAAGHVKVVLSGEGADELFGGYNIYREPEALKKVAWIPFRLRRAVRKLAAKLPDVKGRDFLIRAGMKVEERFIGNAYIYREKEKAQILKNKVTGPSTQEYLRPFYEELESENRGSLQDMEKMQSVDLNYWLPGDILQKADKMSMAHSLEVRVPFLDKEVFDFAAKLPKETKIAAGTTKYIFRKAVSEFLPQETDERKKLGFPIPIRVWLRQDDWYQMVTDLFTSKEAEEFFHTEKLLQLLNDHKDKKADNSRKIWTVLTFLIWYDRFFCYMFEGRVGYKAAIIKLQYILFYIHNNALIRCLEEFKKNKFVPAEEAEKQIKLLNFPLSVEKLVDAIKKVFSNEKMRIQTIESMEEIFEEMKEFSYIMKGAENDIFLHGKGSEEQIYNNDGNSVVQQHRKWLIVMADFPKVFVAQLRDMIYPKSYVHRQKETCWYILKQIY